MWMVIFFSACSVELNLAPYFGSRSDATQENEVESVTVYTTAVSQMRCILIMPTILSQK